MEHYPLSFMSDTGPLEFVIKGVGEEYMDYQTLLYTYKQMQPDLMARFYTSYSRM